MHMPLARHLRVVSRAGEVMSDDFAVVREEIELTKSWQALDRIEAELERLHIRDKMRDDGERHLLSEVEARDAEIKALRKELVLFRREVAS